MPADLNDGRKATKDRYKRSGEHDEMTIQGALGERKAGAIALAKSGHSGAVGSYLPLEFNLQQIINCIITSELALRCFA